MFKASLDNKRLSTDPNGNEIVDLTSSTFRNNEKISQYFLRKVPSDYRMRPDLIALAELGTTDKTEYIMMFNQIGNPFSIDKDDILMIPELIEADSMIWDGNESPIMNNDDTIRDILVKNYYKHSNREENLVDMSSYDDFLNTPVPSGNASKRFALNGVSGLPSSISGSSPNVNGTPGAGTISGGIGSPGSGAGTPGTGTPYGPGTSSWRFPSGYTGSQPYSGVGPYPEDTSTAGVTNGVYPVTYPTTGGVPFVEGYPYPNTEIGQSVSRAPYMLRGNEEAVTIKNGRIYFSSPGMSDIGSPEFGDSSLNPLRQSPFDEILGGGKPYETPIKDYMPVIPEDIIPEQVDGIITEIIHDKETPFSDANCTYNGTSLSDFIKAINDTQR